MIDQTLMAIAFALLMTCVFLIIDAVCDKINNNKMDKERKEALEALLAVVEDIEMLRIGTWKPDDDSCDATVDNLKLVIKYIEKTKGV